MKKKLQLTLRKYIRDCYEQPKRNEQTLRKVQSPKTQPEKKVENRNRSVSSKAIELVILKCPAKKKDNFIILSYLDFKTYMVCLHY